MAWFIIIYFKVFENPNEDNQRVKIIDEEEVAEIQADEEVC